MPWRELARFSDRSVPKLHNLRRAAAAGSRVPATWWLPARGGRGAERAAPARPPARRPPLIVRSGSPTEDTHATSNAGQLLSLAVQAPAAPGAFGDALARVAAALPRDANGRPLGAVFVQPLVEGRGGGGGLLRRLLLRAGHRARRQRGGDRRARARRGGRGHPSPRRSAGPTGWPPSTGRSGARRRGSTSNAPATRTASSSCRSGRPSSRWPATRPSPRQPQGDPRRSAEPVDDLGVVAAGREVLGSSRRSIRRSGAGRRSTRSGWRSGPG